MAVHQLRNVWLSALGLLTALLWIVQLAADWFVPHSDIRIAELDKIELAHVIHTEHTDSSREARLESKSDPEAITAGPFAAGAIGAARSGSWFSAGSAHRKSAATLPGIRAPPHYFFSA